jgi:hypothetical protein
MLIIKGEAVVNLDNVFSMRLAGAGGRTIVFRGSDSLTMEMHFPNKDDAMTAINQITEASQMDWTSTLRLTQGE